MMGLLDEVTVLGHHTLDLYLFSKLCPDWTKYPHLKSGAPSAHGPSLLGLGQCVTAGEVLVSQKKRKKDGIESDERVQSTSTVSRTSSPISLLLLSTRVCMLVAHAYGLGQILYPEGARGSPV